MVAGHTHTVAGLPARLSADATGSREICPQKRANNCHDRSYRKASCRKRVGPGVGTGVADILDVARAFRAPKTEVVAMKLPLTVTFRDVTPSDWIEADIRKRADKLE